MRSNKLGWILGIAAVVIGLGYFGYTKFFLPRYIASIIVYDKVTPNYLPTRYEKRFLKSRKQINLGADSVLHIIHSKHVSLEQLLKAIDEVEEEQAYNFLDELSSITIVSSNQVFDIGKKYFKPDFDVELFREVFERKASVSQIKRGVILANKHRDEGDMSPEMLRAVAKQILIEKEKKLTQELGFISK